MGYSCTARADLTLEGLYHQGVRGLLEGKIALEIGREQKDGAITGTVAVLGMPYLDNGIERWPVIKQASFRIDPDGRIVRMPYVPREIKQRAEEYGRAELNRLFGSTEKEG